MVGSIRPTGSPWKKSLAALGMISVVGLAPQPASAAPIHHASKAQAQIAHSWSTYLLASPSVWTSVHAPSFSPAVRNMIWSELRSGSTTATPMINYLEWRRSLNPARFDFYHPNLGPALARLMNQPTASVPQTITPSTPAPQVAPLTPPSTLVPGPNVPEPSTLVLTVLMAIWGLWSRRRLQFAVTRRTN